MPTSIANYDLSAYRNALNDGTIRYILKRDLSIPLCVVGDDHPPLRLIGVRHGYCLLYTSDAADERSSVDLGGRRILNTKKNIRA